MKEYIVHEPKDKPCAIEEYTSFYGIPIKELIRCKDCKYCKVYEVFGHTLPLCNRIKTMIADALEEDDYCSRAERREE